MDLLILKYFFLSLNLKQKSIYKEMYLKFRFWKVQ